MPLASVLVDLTQDAKISLRSLLRAPLLTAIVIATVGLGIGATTVIFSAVNAALLRPLPYEDPDRLFRIYTDAPPNRFRFSVVDYQALEVQQTQFERIATYTDRAMGFSDGTVAERLRGREVSWTYFGVLGRPPAIGRDFTENDGRPGSPPTVIVSHGFWQRRLGGRANASGSAVRLDGVDHVIAGVLGPAIGPLEQGQEFFVAARWDPPRRRGPFLYTVIARLRDGSSIDTAVDELRAINRRIFPIWRTSYQDDRATWNVIDLKSHVTGEAATTAGLALAAVALVWLIACTNASNLLVARITSRRRELAVRAALGATRGRVVRYLLVESGLLATAAAALGVVLASVGVGLLRDHGAAYFPRTQEIAIDGSLLWMLAALTAASALVFGLIPAFHGTGGPLDESLRAIGRSSTGSVAVRRLRQALVGSQFAIATPLLVVAALLLVSLNALGRVDLGFDSRNLVSGSISLPPIQSTEPERVAAFWDELRRRVEALPGVAGTAYADGRPPADVGNFNNFDLETRPTPTGQSQPVAPWVAVSPDYFRLLGLALLEGRLLDERDAQVQSLESVVVDAAWSRRFFPGESAVGKRFREGGCTTCPWTTVVGVVSVVKYAGLNRPDEGTVYMALPPPTRSRYLIVRTNIDPVAAVPSIQRTLVELDPNLPLANVATIDELVDRSLLRPRSLSTLVAAFAVVGLVLSVIGIYGVMAYYVQQHAKDISIRLALGGSPQNVMRLILGQGLTVVASGVIVGLLAALAATRLMAALLFGVGATDAWTFAGVAAFMLGIAAAACFLPARRAVGLQPATVLRNE